MKHLQDCARRSLVGREDLEDEAFAIFPRSLDMDDDWVAST